MIHNIANNKYDIILDCSVKENLNSFKQEVLDELYNVHMTHGDMALLFSGGMDSTFILRCLQELGLSPKTLSFSFTKDNSDFDCQLVKQKCVQYGVSSPEFFFIDEKKLFDHSSVLIEQKQIIYPMEHGYIMDYFLSNTGNSKFYCGMQAEYKLDGKNVIMPCGPVMVKMFNPDRLYGFTTDRTFLSYFKHSLFVNNYKNSPFFTETGFLRKYNDLWFIRDLIYQDIFPDMIKENKMMKTPWRQHITTHYNNNIVPQIMKHAVIRPCVFDADFLVNI